MLVCRFHPHKGAKTYCPQCRFFLCESCGKPGTMCKLCNKARLVDPSRAPSEVTEVRACALHPRVTTGLKTCQSCGKPHCSTCMKFGGLCVTCARKDEEARDAMPRPELAEPKVAKKRRKQKEQSVAQKFRKDRKRTLIRWTIGGAVLAAVGGLIYFDYAKFKEFAAMGVKMHHKTAAALQDQQAGGNAGNYEALVSRLESGEVTDTEVAETEALMAKISNGEAVDNPGKNAANRLMAMMQDPEKAARLKAQSEKSKKLWAALSEWSAEEEAQAPAAAPGQPGQAVRTYARTSPRRVAPPPAPKPLSVALGGLRSGQNLRGVAVVNAQVHGDGMLDH
ncbi:MAG TPA: hypothetical protein V6D05_03030, partial [Stenomitos sp.]